jgi:hypothetical protein
MEGQNSILVLSLAAKSAAILRERRSTCTTIIFLAAILSDQIKIISCPDEQKHWGTCSDKSVPAFSSPAAAWAWPNGILFPACL